MIYYALTSLMLAFLEKCKEAKAAEADMAKAEKLGIDTNLRVIHPLNGEKLPVWIGNFVLLLTISQGTPSASAR